MIKKLPAMTTQKPSWLVLLNGFYKDLCEIRAVIFDFFRHDDIITV